MRRTTSNGGAPAVLLVPGWDDRNPAFYRELALRFTERGWVCRTLDLPDPAASQTRKAQATREHNLQDLLAALDALSGHADVDPEAIAIAGVSYGGYLAAFASAMRPVRWLALRSPAIYRDEGWTTPKEQLDKEDLAAYRQRALRPDDNRVLAACEAFEGDALVVESECDDTVPHPTVQNYVAAFERARSLAHRVLPGADHELSRGKWRQAWQLLLVAWLTQKAQEKPQPPS